MNLAAAPRRGRHAAVKCTVAILVAVLVVAVIELGLRCLWSAPTWLDASLDASMFAIRGDGLALQAGLRGTLPSVPGAVAINALGMRGLEIVAKLPGERRLLLLGDELVWGEGVSTAATLPSCLERCLRTAGAAVLVGNGGVPGFGSTHLAPHLARLDAAFAPDVIVLVGSLGSDTFDDLEPQRTVFAGRLLQGSLALAATASWRARLALQSRTWLWLEAWSAGSVAREDLASSWLLPLPTVATEHPFAVERATAGVFLDRLDGGVGLVAAITLRSSLQEVQRQAGFRPVVFVVLPSRSHVIESERVAVLRQHGLVPAHFERGHGQRLWMDVAKELGIVAFDATPILAVEADPASLFQAAGRLLSAKGHAVVATWLASELSTVMAK